jgi:hypothetical protein
MATSPMNSTTLFWQEWWLKKLIKEIATPLTHEFFQQFFFSNAHDINMDENLCLGFFVDLYNTHINMYWHP